MLLGGAALPFSAQALGAAEGHDPVYCAEEPAGARLDDDVNKYREEVIGAAHAVSEVPQQPRY